MGRPTWDNWAIGLAHVAARRADCSRRQIGAVVLDAEHRVLSAGYNGAPAKVPGCASAGGCPRGQLTHDDLPKDSPYTGAGVAHPCIAIHAEENALLYSDPVRRRGGLLAISDAPCPSCLRLIAGSGVARAVWPGGTWSAASPAVI